MDAVKAFISPPGTRGGAHQQLQEGTGAWRRPGGVAQRRGAQGVPRRAASRRWGVR
jgi:hypothetical protein